MDIAEITEWVSQWKPTHFITLNLLPNINNPPKEQCEKIITGAFNCIQRWSYNRHFKPPEKILAIGWQEIGIKSMRNHFHIIIRFPPHRIDRQSPIDTLQRAWAHCARGIGAEIWTAPISNATGAIVYSQKQNGGANNPYIYL